MEGGEIIRKGIELGSGSYGFVFRAVETSTQRVVALKQSRSSLRLKRPPLQHEARVLKLLSGHPNIPEVYAYGRIEHFELMTIELLHRSLGDVVKADGPLGIKMVANIASQMIDALQHVHSHSLVHRDIKPNNIMLQSSDSWKLCLIDFGLTRPLPSLAVLTTPTTCEDSNSVPDRPAHVFGTLPYASLNAHKKDSQLTFRDDLESLAYTLLWLLRGSLPWSHYPNCGPEASRIRQVLAQKKRHTGSTLAADLPVEFGELVDYARSLSLDGKPDYNEWRGRLKHVEESATGNDILVSQHKTPDAVIDRPEPPLEVGQIILIKLDPAITAEGFSIREGHESSFIPDPLFDAPEWSTVFRPGVVAQVKWEERERKYIFLAIPISRGLNADERETTRAIPIATTGSHTSGTFPSIQIEPEWPHDNSHFYVFKRPVQFYCLPSQERVHSTWRIASSDCDTLLKHFTPPPELLKGSQEQVDLKSPDPDVRHDARMRGPYCHCNFYARLQTLTPTHFEDDSIDWFSKRAWFDECVKAQRHTNLHEGFWWTGAWFPSTYRRQEGEITESWCGWDFSMWQPVNEERRTSITLPSSNEDAEGTDDQPGGLATIVGLELEPKAQEL